MRAFVLDYFGTKKSYSIRFPGSILMLLDMLTEKKLKSAKLPRETERLESNKKNKKSTLVSV